MPLWSHGVPCSRRACMGGGLPTQQDLQRSRNVGTLLLVVGAAVMALLAGFLALQRSTFVERFSMLAHAPIAPQQQQQQQQLPHQGGNAFEPRSRHHNGQEDSLGAPKPSNGDPAQPETRNGCQVTAEMIAYTAERIRQAQVSKEVFPHMQVTEVFRADLFECIKRNLPPKDTPEKWLLEVYPDQRPGGKAINNDARYFLNMWPPENRAPHWREAAAKALLPTMDLRFWDHFTRVYINSTDIVDAVLEKFKPTLALRWGDVVEEWLTSGARYYAWGGYLDLRLTRDLKGYFVAPHTDNMRKIVTSVYYLDVDPQVQPTAGTRLYRGPEVTDATGIGDEFIPNSLLMFVPCKQSWHGVSTITAKNPRDTIQLNYHIPELNYHIPKTPCFPSSPPQSVSNGNMAPITAKPYRNKGNRNNGNMDRGNKQRATRTSDQNERPERATRKRASRDGANRHRGRLSPPVSRRHGRSYNRGQSVAQSTPHRARQGVLRSGDRLSLRHRRRENIF